ncbi:isoaspartyl peptidase/L-asparaginase family protein [soil metagenome]
MSIVSFGASGSGFLVLVHGGAGDLPAEARPSHASGCRSAVVAAAACLRSGGSALDAAETAVNILEDDPRFNAGTGACLTEDGTLELDASIMDGATLAAGAVCALPPFKNPISIARAVLRDGRHVLYASEGAARFAEARGFVPIRDDSMITDAVRARFELLRARKGGVEGFAGGTVGAVVRDASGTFAAATSTGGMFMKGAGRVGDSPILGAGTYADDEAGACSNTGHGESMMRLCLAKAAIDSLREGRRAEDAARAAIELMARRTGGTGGMILVDRSGGVGWARNTTTMSWGAYASDWAEPKSGA